LTLFSFLDPLVQQFGQILLLAADAFHDLNNDPSTLQLDLLAFTKLLFTLPVHVPDGMAALIVDHDALVEGVVFEAAILPSLLLPPEIVGKQADEIEDRGAASAAAGV
jgi:hypothetical protein